MIMSCRLVPDTSCAVVIAKIGDKNVNHRMRIENRSSSDSAHDNLLNCL